MCIQFGSKINIDEHVPMNRFPVQLSERVRHLGNFVARWIADTNDQYLLDMLSKFGHLQPHKLMNLFIFILILLFFFGSSTWRMNSAGFKSCTTAWNVGVRRPLNLTNTTHTWLLGPLLDSVHMTYTLCIRYLKCIYCMKKNDN